MGKLGFMVGFGAGYVLGSKAGKERYDQLRRLWDNVATSPQVRQAGDRAKNAAGSGIAQARGKATEGVQKVQGAVQNRRGQDSGSGNLSVAPPPG